MKRLAILTAVVLMLGMTLGKSATDCRSESPAECRQTNATSQTFFSEVNINTVLISEVPAAVASVPQIWSVNTHSGNSYLHRAVVAALHRKPIELSRRTATFVSSAQKPLAETPATEYYVITLRKIII